jgi:hypothetical protein
MIEIGGAQPDRKLLVTETILELESVLDWEDCVKISELFCLRIQQISKRLQKVHYDC